MTPCSVLIYPFTGPGGVQITRGEHRRLEPSEFLNDTIIEFGLRSALFIDDRPISNLLLDSGWMN